MNLQIFKESDIQRKNEEFVHSQVTVTSLLFGNNCSATNDVY